MQVHYIRNNINMSLTSKPRIIQRQHLFDTWGTCGCAPATGGDSQSGTGGHKEGVELERPTQSPLDTHSSTDTPSAADRGWSLQPLEWKQFLPPTPPATSVHRLSPAPSATT
eukprot:TRINITY_DN1514_c0_g1_i1.p2 TRINITY_DN1514_c0_g1~~TRINITY_DN1514_c0_g1_i1.p2  ORF type:complete len:112 (-),score=9.33 TRINITY_DN1514_c0_g1_i1:79-414(-)